MATDHSPTYGYLTECPFVVPRTQTTVCSELIYTCAIILANVLSTVIYVDLALVTSVSFHTLTVVVMETIHTCSPMLTGDAAALICVCETKAFAT